MAYIVSQITKYCIMVLFLIYTAQCFFVFRYKSEHERSGIYFRQNIVMVLIHLLSFFTLLVNDPDAKYILAFASEEAVILLTIILYRKLYPKSNRLLINNMCMLLIIGLVIIGRISFDKSLRQFVIMTVALVVALFIPWIIKKFNRLEKFKWIYAFTGTFSLLVVLLFSTAVNGSKLNITVFNYTFQPSEYVKIIFVFAMACFLLDCTEFKDIVIASVVAGAHVLLLVASRDLGSAVIFFMVYFAMLYVATGNVFYYLGGFASGAAFALVGYKLFSHVRVRVLAFRDPFGTIESAGYQIAQSLFAIGTGSWFGMGLSQGAPKTIPVVTADFIFSAIVEELGIIFGICLILVCLSCLIMFLNIAMRSDDKFLKLIAVGLSVEYGFQVFLTIGGVTKFIPLTGVTLPLVSYGGTSIVVTLCIFAIIQGLYITRGSSSMATYKSAATIKASTPSTHPLATQIGREPLLEKTELDRPTRIIPDDEDISFNMAVEEGLRLARENSDDYALSDFELFDDDDE